VVEIGAINRCGDISKRRSAASRLLEGTRLGHRETEPISGVVVDESSRVLEYLTGRINHLTSRARAAT